MTAIHCEHISVQYTSPTHASMSLKESLIGLVKGHGTGSRYFNALDDVTLNVQKGECVAFIGPNGCGKSTLLKVVAGVITPQKGVVETSGIIAPMIELGAGFDQELTGVENIWMACRLMGASHDLIESKLKEIMDFAELGDFIYAPVKTYSSGMYMRLGFACSTIINPDLLLIDEILAVGDSRFQKKCIDRIHQIQADKKTIVLVSHDKAMIESLCSRAVLLWHGQKVYEGKPEIAFQIYDRLMDNPLLSQQPSAAVEEVLRLRQLIKSPATSQVTRRIGECNVTGSLIQKGPSHLLDLGCRIVTLGPSESPLTVGFQIRQKNGGRAFGTNTRYQSNVTPDQRTLLTQEGEIAVRWIYDCSVLASGEYVVDVCISNYEITEVYEFLREAVTFLITHSGDPLNHDKNMVEMESHGFSVIHKRLESSRPPLATGPV